MKSKKIRTSEGRVWEHLKVPRQIWGEVDDRGTSITAKHERRNLSDERQRFFI